MQSIYKNDARRLFDLGLKPIPLNRKIPFFKDWQNMEITSDDVDAWTMKYPDCNIGIVCGSATGILVVDFDGPNEMSRLKSETGIDLDIATPTCITKRGFHKYFRYPVVDQPIKNIVKLIIGGIQFEIDIRGNGGQVVAPPSIHPVDPTVQYHWAEGLAFDEVPLLSVPDELLSILIQLSLPKTKKEKTKSVQSSSPASEAKPSINSSRPPMGNEIQDGERNDTLFRMACRYRSQGLSSDEARSLIDTANQTRCSEPLDEVELGKLVESAYSYTIQQYELNERGFAQQFYDIYRDQIKFCIEDGYWYIWNGACWRRDVDGEMKRMADRVVDKFNFDIETMHDSDPMKKQYLKYAISLGNYQKQTNMLKYLESFPGNSISQSNFDRHRHLLNCSNGIIDLRTGELQKADPDLLMSRQIEIEYDANAEYSLWMEFLKSITNNNTDLIEYLQGAVGYSMTGETNEEVIFFLYGNGCNGKSTFINAFNSILGSLAKTMPSKTLMLGRNDNSAPNDIAMLKGVRLAATTELPEGKQLNEELIKSLASQDMITARYLFKEFFEFSPTHKWWISGNHKPKIVGQDYGIWRRLKLIPFEITIPPENRDKNLSKKLDEEQPGILRWMVEGAVKWYRDGLREPKIIIDAVEEYRNEMDIIGDFIVECCHVDGRSNILATELYELYRKYCEANVQYAIGKRMFYVKMVERGFKKNNCSRNQLFIQGIKAAKAPSHPAYNSGWS